MGLTSYTVCTNLKPINIIRVGLCLKHRIINIDKEILYYHVSGLKARNIF